MTYQPATTFSIDKVLDHSIKIYFQKIPHFIGISILLNLPSYLISVFLFDMSNIETYLSFSWIISNLVISLLSTAILTSAIIRISYETISNSDASISLGSSMAICFRNFISIFIAAIAMVFAIVLGFCLLIVPGLIAATRLYFTIPAVVMEGAAPFTAMSRSDNLSYGYRWHIFGLLIIVGLVNGVASQVLGFMFMKSDPALYFNLYFLFVVVFSPLISIVQTVAYYHIRSVKEGAAIEELLKVFE